MKNGAQPGTATRIPPGYKQTEVGVIPEAWEVRALGDVGHIGTGPFGTLLRADEYYAVEGVPLVSVKDIGAGVLQFGDHTPLVPREIVRRMPEYVLRTGDIVFGRKGGVDRSALVQDRQDGCFLGSDGIRIRPEKACHPPFVACQLQRKPIQEWLLQNCTGTTMPSMNQGILRRLSLPLPPLPEQRAIAEALGDADTLIESLDRLIAKKRDLKQAAMQELLTGKRRLPGFSGKWEVKRLGDVAPLQRGFDLPTAKLRHGPYPVVYSNGILNHHAAFLAKCPGVVTGRSGTIGKVCFVEQDYWPHNTSLWVTDFRGNNPRFVYYLYTLISLERLATGSGVPTLNRNDVHARAVLVPAAGVEQTAIAAVLSDMDAELAALEARRDKAKAVKQGMMQELLTGRIRLV